MGKNRKSGDFFIKSKTEKVSPLSSLIEISGNREISIEGVKGIIEYNDQSVRVSMGNMLVSFFGRGLSINCLRDSSLVIKGFITKLEFLS